MLRQRIFRGPGYEYRRRIISYGFGVSVSDPSVLAFVGATSGPLFDTATTAPGAGVFGAASGFGIFDPVTEPLLIATLTLRQ